MAVHAQKVERGKNTRRRDRTKPALCMATGAIVTGVALESGWPEIGSTMACTSAAVRASLAVSSFQWIGTKMLPRSWFDVTLTR